MEQVNNGKKNFLGWFVCVCGWLICAAMCLITTICLEAYPAGYEMFIYAIVLILFCNVFAFLFIASRFGNLFSKLSGSVMRVCVAEGLFLSGIYCIGRFAF